MLIESGPRDDVPFVYMGIALVILILSLTLFAGLNDYTNERRGTIKIYDKRYMPDGNIEVIDHANKTWVLETNEGAVYYFIECGNMYEITYTENLVFQHFGVPHDRRITSIRKVTEFVI